VRLLANHVVSYAHKHSMLILFCGAILKIASVAQCVARLFVPGNRRSYTFTLAGKYFHRYNLALAYTCRDKRAAYTSSMLTS
jgi:hypothetical protein